MGLKTCQFCRTVYDATFVGVLLENIAHHHVQLVAPSRGLLDHFVVEVLPIQWGREEHRLSWLCRCG